MRAIGRWTLVLIAVLAAVPAMAGKIGFVDAERAVASVAQGEIKLKELEEWANPRREQIEQMRTEALAIRDQIEKQRNVSPPEVVAKLEQDLQTAGRRFEDSGRSFNRELEAKQSELLGEVAQRVGQVASDYAKANDYDAIFVLNTQPMIYVSEAADLTDVVIGLYDEQFPVN